MIIETNEILENRIDHESILIESKHFSGTVNFTAAGHYNPRQGRWKKPTVVLDTYVPHQVQLFVAAEITRKNNYYKPSFIFT